MPTADIKPDAASLRELLKDFDSLPPKIKTDTRRALRRTGDDIIAAQRAILDGPLPPAVAVTGSKLTLGCNKKTGRSFLRSVNVYGDKKVQRPGRSSGLREGIKAALVTRVVTGDTRQGIDIRTQNSRATMSTGWNAGRFRHPVFGNTDKWVYQAGQPYFFDPVFKGRAALIESAITLINNAVEGR